MFSFLNSNHISARNPKDTIGSFYYHHLSFSLFEFDEKNFDIFFSLFLEKRLEYGDYFDVVPEWWQRSKEKSNIHFVLYEVLKTDFEKLFNNYFLRIFSCKLLYSLRTIFSKSLKFFKPCSNSP